MYIIYISHYFTDYISELVKLWEIYITQNEKLKDRFKLL